MLGVAEAELRSAWAGVLWVEGARVGYDDLGLTGSLEGGASGGAAAEATAVLMLDDVCGQQSTNYHERA